jgi:hypothetical protein
MMYGSDTYGSASYGSAGTAAGTSSAVAAGASFTATVRTGRAVVVGQAVEVDEAVVELDGTPPPAAAERVLCYLLPKRRRNDILGCIAEDYWTEFLPKFGAREARRMYWSQFIRSVAASVPWAVGAAVLGAVGWLWNKLGG